MDKSPEFEENNIIPPMNEAIPILNVGDPKGENVRKYIALHDEQGVPVDFDALRDYIYEGRISARNELGIPLDPIDDGGGPVPEDFVFYLDSDQITDHFDEVINSGASLDDIIQKLDAKTLRENEDRLIEAGASKFRIRKKLAKAAILRRQ